MVIKSGIYAIADRFLGLLFGFGSVYLLLRLLTPPVFGEWALFVTVTALIEVARNGLIQNALIQHLAAAPPDQHRHINTASLALNVSLTLLSMLVLWVGAPLLARLWQAPSLDHLFKLYALTTLVLVPFSQALFLQQANTNFAAILYSNAVRQGVFFGYVAYLFARHQTPSLYALGLCQLWAAVAAAAAALYLARHYWQLSWQVQGQWVWRLFHFGKYVLGTNLAAMIYKSVDKMMLGSLLSDKVPVATYDLAIRINNLNEVPTLALAATLFPESAKRAQQSDTTELRQLYEQSVGIMLAMVLPGVVAVCLFPALVIRLFAGSQYMYAIEVVQLTALYSLFLPFAVQFGTVFDAMGKPQLNFGFVALGTMVNAAINYFLIRRYGLNGAVYATLITFVLTFVGNQYLLRRVLGVRFGAIIYHFGATYGLLWAKLKQVLRKVS